MRRACQSHDDDRQDLQCLGKPGALGSLAAPIRQRRRTKKRIVRFRRFQSQWASRGPSGWGGGDSEEGGKALCLLLRLPAPPRPLFSRPPECRAPKETLPPFSPLNLLTKVMGTKTMSFNRRNGGRTGG
jgi:hypothetical protein